MLRKHKRLRSSSLRPETIEQEECEFAFSVLIILTENLPTAKILSHLNNHEVWMHLNSY